MEIIAVVQLDKLIKQIQQQQPTLLIEKLKTQVNLLKQCHTVTQWIFTESSELSTTQHTEIESDLAIELKTGPSSDPLNEFYEAAAGATRKNNPRDNEPLVVRLIPNIENPVPQIIDAVIENHLIQQHHYSRNRNNDFDESLNIEVMNFSVLDEAWREALLPDDRIHITPYIFRQNQRLNLGYFPPTDLGSLTA